MLYEIKFTAAGRQLPDRLRPTSDYPPLPIRSDSDYKTWQSEAACEDNLVEFSLLAGRGLLTFEYAKLRLLAYIRNRIRNGEVTERALARQIGISQPHVHNALKGVRTFSPEVLDKILRQFRLSLLDLISRPIERDDQTEDANSSGRFQLKTTLHREGDLTRRAAS